MVSEKEFIDTINAELDWGAMEAMLLERHNFHLRDDVAYKGGDLVVHKNQIAYKLDFEIKLSLSVIVGRDGECLDITSSAEAEPKDERSLDLLADDGENPVGNMGNGGAASDFSSMASTLAEMISDINQEVE